MKKFFKSISADFWITLILTVAFLMLLLTALVARAELSQSSPAIAPEPKLMPLRLVKVEVVRLSGFSIKDQERFKLIASRVEKIVNSHEFAMAMNNHKIQSLKGSPQGFYDLAAPLKSENVAVLAAVLLNDWKLDYESYCTSWGSVAGYTYANVKWIRLNTCHSNFKRDELVAQNICHEYGGHKQGFRHTQKHNRHRPYSVPYAMGSICRDLYVKTFGGAK